uniref:T9SS type A sorting domain-containing protein n=1 Tax=Flavobacterium alvei TaxID=2080416 RepID=UPI0026F219C5
FVAKAKNIGGLYPFLYDKYTQAYTEIPADGAVAYNYSVVGTDVQSTASSRFNVVFKTQSSLSNKSLELESELKVYPNPVKEGWFVISSPNSTQGMEIEVFNLLGQRIPFTVSNVNSNNLKIEIPKSVDKGVYSVEIKQNGQKETKKILIN